MLRGLNWGHRRATGPMEAVAREARRRWGVDLTWEQQTLAGFEHGATPEAVDRFDLVVFDHPHCGDIARGGFLRPLEAHLPDLRNTEFVGASLESYRYAGRLWGLPVDGCTQSAVYRPDLLGDQPLPRSWSEAIALGHALRREGRWLGLATAAPHGVLLLLALCANLGHPIAQDPWATPFDTATVAQAAELLCEVHALAHPADARMNAIQLHDAMAQGDERAYCPGAYAYLCYADRDCVHPLQFGPFPGPNGGAAGTVLGGTGLGITRSCHDVEAALHVVRMLAGAQEQRDLIMGHHGQPGRVEPWVRAAGLETAFEAAHVALRPVIDQAWMRPRFPGFLAWQSQAGAVVEQMLRSEVTPTQIGDRLERLWRSCAPSLG